MSSGSDASILQGRFQSQRDQGLISVIKQQGCEKVAIISLYALNLSGRKVQRRRWSESGQFSI
jgi:hypothetical protein